jgi:hypothetical protein
LVNPVETVKNRPAETATPIAMILAALIAKFAGVEDEDTIIYLAVVISFVPAGVTWLVELVRNRQPNE